MSAQTTDLYIPEDVTRPMQKAVAVLIIFLLALGVWATQASFATTLKVPGETGSSAPSFEIQHFQGGQIETVAVELHDHVNAGDLLFQIDTHEIRLQQQALQTEKSHHEAVLSQIGARLSTQEATATRSNPSVERAYALKDAALSAEISNLRTTASAARVQITHLEAELETLRALQRLLERRVHRASQLFAKGLTTEQTVENAKERTLEGEAQVAAKLSTITALQDTAETSDRQVNLLQFRDHADLADLEMRTRRELANVDLELAQLAARQKNAEVRAPVTGEVTGLPFRAAGMIARPGVTLAVVSQRFSQPYVTLHVPPNYIDQVTLGQEGQVMIPGLPTRETPKLRIHVTALSDQPVLDGNGQTLHYLARAEVNGEDLDLARSTLGQRFQLAHGMPVSAILTGDHTTLWSFLSSPLRQVWATALED